MNGFIQKIGDEVIVFEDSSIWRALATSINWSMWQPLDPVEITGPGVSARMTNMRTTETIPVEETPPAGDNPGQPATVF